MYVEYIPPHYDRARLSDAWFAWEHRLFATHVLTEEERVRWEWGEACWTAKILSEGEVAGIYLRKIMEVR